MIERATEAAPRRMRHQTLRPRATPSLPKPAPLAMPVQDLRSKPRVRRIAPRWSTRVARIVNATCALAITAYAAGELSEAVSVGQTGALQVSLVVLFCLTFGWIAFAAVSAVVGFCTPSVRPAASGADGESQDNGSIDRVAIVMPVYNEDPVDVVANLLSMAEALIDAGEGNRFELFLISDTTDPDIWVRETAAFGELRDRLHGRMPCWYRHRYRNTARKSGNVEDFVTRFGARYDAMLMLDADSLMAAETIVQMVRELEADPRLGLFQTVPVLAGGGRGLLSRSQGFASALYGPSIARGVAAWQGEHGNYWGHNAMIRTAAFAASCGLPVLKGRRPIGGEILSHDFVEAALLVRRGWKVRMDPDLGGSFEEGPPSLIDLSVRDRRWAQGNVQHTGVMGAAGLAPTSRFHFALGIASYFASPLWLAMTVVGIALAIQVAVTQPVYFGDAFQLYPNWPVFDSERMVALFVLSMGLLLLPKALGLLRALCSRKQRDSFGGARVLLTSAFVELVLSSLYAPVLMLMQSRQMFDILRGKDSGWNAQTRDDGLTPWSEVFRRHWVHTVIGVVTTAVVYTMVPNLVLWMAPTLLGLVIACFLSRASGSEAVGTKLRRWGLLLTPSEIEPPSIQLRKAHHREELNVSVPQPDNAQAVLEDPETAALHYQHVEPPPAAPRGKPDADRLATTAKVQDARTVEEAWQFLSKRERMILLADGALYEQV